jgi:hypothetical protein
MPFVAKKRLLCVFLLAWSGCAKDAGTPASPVQVSLSDAQAMEVRSVLREGLPSEGGPPLTLLPASGVRWSDVTRAVRSAGADPDILCAVVHSDLGDTTGTIQLRTAEGWPVVVRVHRGEGRIGFDVEVGPYPAHADAKAEARRLEAAIMTSLREWGRKPELPS